MSVVIRVEKLTKEYRLGEFNRGTLYEEVQSWWARLRGHEDPNSKVQLGGTVHRSGNRLLALDDVSFEVSAGEAIGVIGRNGAGKSTLLKVLSQITAPTSGRVLIKGQIASLLEVGTGFHPELTGRENVYLNGAILGMTKREIDSRFDEIADFSGVEEFLDTPVKRYSSGMKVRLAFSVAAHLQPEILIIDEVLAVGDAAFQKKCLNKMQDVGKGGRTILFVSHNTAAVARLCPRAILMQDGQLIANGTSHDVIARYLDSGAGSTAVREWPELTKAPGNHIARLRSVRVLSDSGEHADRTDIKSAVHLEMTYDVIRAGMVLVPNFHLYNDEGICIFIAIDHSPEWRGRAKPEGTYTTTVTIPGNLLSEGRIIVNAALSTPKPVVVHFHESDTVAFTVIDDLSSDGARGEFTASIPGVVRPLLPWETTVLAPAAALHT